MYVLVCGFVVWCKVRGNVAKLTGLATHCKFKGDRFGMSQRHPCLLYLYDLCIFTPSTVILWERRKFGMYVMNFGLVVLARMLQECNEEFCRWS